MDRTDFEFLTCMNRLLSSGADMARAYLANSGPETRLANVGDLARNTITEHDRIMGDITNWLADVEPPEPEDDGPMMMY